MERWNGKVAIVTGASAGIGAAICKALVQNGLKVVGLARRVERIEELADALSEESGKLYAVQCDLSKDENIIEAFEWVRQNVGLVHILVNNAGFMKNSSLLEGSTEDWKDTFDVNVMALLVASREAIKIMRENDIAGHIININSIFGHAVPDMGIAVFNVYPATKYAVTALTETLRLELKYNKSDIKITSISPGYVKTEFQESMPDDLQEYMENLVGLSADDIADTIVYVLGTPPTVQIQEIILQAVGA